MLGISITRNKNLSSSKIEILSDESSGSSRTQEIIVEVAGCIERPGVYKLVNGSRVEDLLIAGGGISADADRVWIEKFLNRAAPLSDGQKVYIPKIGEQTVAGSAKNNEGYQTISPILGAQGSALININTASLKELDSLPGIGPIYGQNIIDHRPYSNTEELKTKGVIKASLFEKIKSQITAN